MTEGEALSTAPLQVYICYLRASDYSFASDLAAALNMLADFNVSLDRADINEGEDWQGRLSAQIAAAGTVLFVMSPRSADSPSCRWELKEAERLSKRIIPVLVEPLSGTPPPGPVAQIPYVRFDHGHSFVDGLKELRIALDQDLDWLAEHARLFARAREWDVSRRPDNRLLVGEDVTAAKAWLDWQPAGGPPPSQLHRDFIRASDLLEAERQGLNRSRTRGFDASPRWLQVALTACVVALLGIGGYAYYSHQVTASVTAEKQRAIAAWQNSRRALKQAEYNEQKFEEAAARILDIVFSARSTEARRALGPIVMVLLRDLSPQQVQRLQDRVAEFGQFQRERDGSISPQTQQALDDWVEALERLRAGATGSGN